VAPLLVLLGLGGLLLLAGSARAGSGDRPVPSGPLLPPKPKPKGPIDLSGLATGSPGSPPIPSVSAAINGTHMATILMVPPERVDLLNRLILAAATGAGKQPPVLQTFPSRLNARNYLLGAGFREVKVRNLPPLPSLAAYSQAAVLTAPVPPALKGKLLPLDATPLMVTVSIWEK